jgi:hypothetical protein
VSRFSPGNSLNRGSGVAILLVHLQIYNAPRKTA